MTARTSTGWRAFSRHLLNAQPAGATWQDNQRCLRGAGALWRDHDHDQERSARQDNPTSSSSSSATTPGRGRTGVPGWVWLVIGAGALLALEGHVQQGQGASA